MSVRGYALGLDFGTSSCRGLVVDLQEGCEVGSHSFAYRSGHDGVIGSDDGRPVARQHPTDYLLGLEAVIHGALRAAAEADPAFDTKSVVGVGVATTGSTPIPVDRRGRPLALSPEFATNIDAMAWLWKDHTAQEEAEALTEMARRSRPEYVRVLGGAYSAEWFWAKIWHCLRVAPDVFQAAYSWIELCDFIPAVLIGVEDARCIPRSLCAAGHKAMFSERWGGLPDTDFLARLAPELAELRPRLFSSALEAGERAGHLSVEWASRTGLRKGIPVAVGGFDAHAAALASGVAEGILVKVLGTSTCDVTVQRPAAAVNELPGVCGIVSGSVLPGFVGIEAGQSGVGDMFHWFADRFVPETYGGTPTIRLAALSERASQLEPGQHGLIALDWVNGNRSILIDHRLSGVLVGMSLETEPHHVLQALFEATAFGALRIVDRLEEFGVPVEEVVASGGLPNHNPTLMQTYADVLGRRIRVSASSQASALGAAALGALAAGVNEGGFATAQQAQERLSRYRDGDFVPRDAAHARYGRMYAMYCRLHDAFGLAATADGLNAIMRELFDLREGSTTVGR